MRTVAAKRQTPRPDLTSAPTGYDWLVYCRENKLLTASEWALAAILVTCGQGQNIMLSVTGMADILHMHRDTVSKAIDGLVAKGLMVEKGKGRMVEKGKGRNNKNNNNKTFYRLTLPKAPATAQMGTSDCLNGYQPLPESVPVDCLNGDHNMKNIDEDEDEDEDVHQHTDDDVRQPSSSGSSRAQEDSPAKVIPPVEDYIADLEGCVDELEHRLGMAPGTVTIKPLAKLWRDLMIKHGQPGAGVAHTLVEFPADSPVWPECAAARRPVGYFLNVIDRWLVQFDPADPNDVQADAQDRVEPEEADREDVAA